jgi:hypothetical protein
MFGDKALYEKRIFKSGRKVSATEWTMDGFQLFEEEENDVCSPTKSVTHSAVCVYAESP